MVRSRATNACLGLSLISPIYVYQVAWSGTTITRLRSSVSKMTALGYCQRSRSYLIYSWDTKRVIRSAEVVFNESVLPFAKGFPPDARISQTSASVPAAPLLPSSLQWGQKDGDPVHMVTLGPTVSSKPRELLASQQKVLHMHPDDVDPELDDLFHTSDEPPPYVAPVVLPNGAGAGAGVPQTVSREVRNLQRTPKCWLPAHRPANVAQRARSSRSIPSTAVSFLAVALRALAVFTPDPSDVCAIAHTAVAFYGQEPATYQEAITCPDADRLPIVGNRLCKLRWIL